MSLFVSYLAFRTSNLVRIDTLKPTIYVSGFHHSAKDNENKVILEKDSYLGMGIKQSIDGKVGHYVLSIYFTNTSRYPGYVILDNYESLYKESFGTNLESNLKTKYFVPSGKETIPIYPILLDKKALSSRVVPLVIPIEYSIFDENDKFLYKIRQNIRCLNNAPEPYISFNCIFTN